MLYYYTARDLPAGSCWLESGRQGVPRKGLENVPMPGQPGGRSVPTPNQAPEAQQVSGVASGFILTSDGYVLTNAHVVAGAEEVYVTLTNKKEYKAKIIGADKRTDVAVLKIAATGLPVVKIGDVNKLRVGEWVIAIGSPFGLDNSVTSGIVSAKARDTGEYVPFIQTDVAINPGNSGGPLLNMRGEVVGINSQIYSRSGGFMGISFSIPIDEAIRISDQLRQSGKVIRGRIGVQIDQVSKDVAESIGLGAVKGALVRSIEQGGPAEKIGLEQGDIIVKFDGHSIDQAMDLPRIVGNTKPGSKVVMQVFRKGSYKDIKVTVGQFNGDDDPAAKANAEKPAPVKAEAKIGKSLGLGLTDLTDAQKKELHIKAGVGVVSVDGAAARAGLQSGDVILAMDNQDITNLKELEAVLNKLDAKKPVNVLFRRGEWAQYALIRR